MKNEKIWYCYLVKYLFILVILLELLGSGNVEATNVLYIPNPNLLGKKPVVKKRARNLFTNDEDERLKELIEEYGEDNWGIIAKNMGGRNVRQCKERWKFYLSPNVNKNEWTEEDDKLLLELQGQFGNKWKLIANYFDGRNEIQVKSRFKLLWRRKNGICAIKNKIKNQVQAKNPPPPSPAAVKIQKEEDFFENYSTDISDFDESNNFDDYFYF